jgi:uncharacterized lipoprotein
MRKNMKRVKFLLLLPVLVTAGACGLLPDAYSGCEKPQPYQSAQELPPLRVPEGAVLPDTRNAMRIPAVSAPEIPASAGPCLDHPPTYGAKPATG